MLEVILWMAAGIAAGVIFRKYFSGWNSQKIIMLVTWLLLFFLGWEAGGDSKVIEALPSIGLDALILSGGGIAGSCLLSWLLWRYVNNKTIFSPDEPGPSASEQSSRESSAAIRSGIRDSLVILAFFVAGIVLGLCRVGQGSPLIHRLSFWSLCVLMFLVGLSVGCAQDLVKSVKAMNPRLALLPAATILGTWAGCLLVNLVTGYASSDVLAIGSGFGYYSLSSVLISESRGAELGTLALISNIIREVFTLLCAPLLVILAGPLAPISSGGATTADTTLPIIRSCCGEKFVLLSIFHGFLVDFTVPFLVSFFCSIA